MGVRDGRAENGTTVHESILDGYRRTVGTLGGDSLAVSIPAEEVDERGIERGDDVAITMDETESGHDKMEIVFESDENE